MEVMIFTSRDVSIAFKIISNYFRMACEAKVKYKGVCFFRVFKLLRDTLKDNTIDINSTLDGFR